MRTGLILTTLLLLITLDVVIARPKSLMYDDSPSTNSSSNNNVTVGQWTFTETSLNQTDFAAQPYVSNGYIGARLPAAGVGFQSFNTSSNNSEAYGQGWPIFGPRVTASMVAGFYDLQDKTLGTNFPQTGGEQVISLLPSWPHLYLTIQQNSTNYTYGPGVDSSVIKNYTQSFSVRNGTVTTQIDWQPNGIEQPINLRYTVIAHRKRPNLGLMQLEISGLQNGTEYIITDAIDGQGAARTQNGTCGNVTEQSKSIYASVEPNGISNVTGYVFSSLQGSSLGNDNVSLPNSVGDLIGLTNVTTITQSYSVSLNSSSQSVTVWKAVGIASSDAFGDQARQTALNAIQQARQSDWNSLIQEHEQEWENEWNEGGEIIIHDQSTPLLCQLQRQARASLFHILTNVRKGSEGPGLGDNSIAPAGLTSDSYAGSIFWDAETFMFPSLSLLFPSFAESILNYRTKLPWQLQKNAEQYGKPGLIYPWVSARFQNCTGIGPCYDYEYHLNNDIVLSQWQYYLQTNNQTFLSEQAWPIMEGVSRFWAAQVTATPQNATLQDNTTYNPPLGVGKYVTLNETDPDEYANFKNNGAYTNAGLTITMLNTLYAASLLNKSIDSIQAQNWSSVANGITLLRENTSNIVLEFEGFNSTVKVKQADVPLLIYPLGYNDQFPQREPEPRSDLTYYSGATDSIGGPGMTFAIYGIAGLQLDGYENSTTGPSCEGFTRLLQSGFPYERVFGQFSEMIDDNYATNGGANPAGGVNPAYTFLTGHGGLLQMWTNGFLGYRAKNTTDHSLYIDPNLPPQLEGGVTIKGVHHGTSILDVIMGNSTTTITHRNGTQAVTVETRNGTQTVEVGQSIQVPTRTTNTMSSDNNQTTNLALCSPIQTELETTVTNQTSSSDYLDILRNSHTGTNAVQGANDGSNATFYQPVFANQSSSIFLDLGKILTLNQIHLNFGQLPPEYFSLSISNSSYQSNSTTNSFQSVIDKMAINITAPYDPNSSDNEKAIVQLPTAWNTTDINLSSTNNSTSSLQARYLNVTMEGVATPQLFGAGATLLEIQVQ